MSIESFILVQNFLRNLASITILVIGKLFVCPSRKIVLEPLDFIQLKGHCIILNQDIAVTQKYNKNPHVKMYYDITHVQVSLCQGISLYNTDIVPVTLEEGEDMF